MGYQWVIGGLSVGYQLVISGLSEGYQWVISGLSVGYRWVIDGLSMGYQCVISKRKGPDDFSELLKRRSIKWMVTLGLPQRNIPPGWLNRNQTDFCYFENEGKKTSKVGSKTFLYPYIV